MSKGWYNQGWRHAMAARSIRTSFAHRPLITNHEIKMIEHSTRKNIGDMSDSEIANHVSTIRHDPAMNARPFNPQPRPVIQQKPDKTKVDYLEPFRSPEEKSDIGKQMIEQKIAQKVADSDSYMTQKNIDFEAKRRIMDHYVNPLVEKFRKGHMSERDFDTEVDSKVHHNTDMNKTDGLGAFSWAEEQPKKEPEPEVGAFNFIDKAKTEMDKNASN